MSGEEEQQAKLEKLKTVRRAHQGVLTKLAREVKEIMSHSELSEEGTSRLKIIREQLVGKMELFSNLDSEIVALCRIDEIEREIKESEATTAKLIESKRKIDDGISTLSRESATHTVPTPSSRDISTTPQLPKLSLPKFRSDVTNWSAF